MTTNQDLRCQVETDISLAVVCFGNELKTGARSTAEFLDAAVSLGFASVELCDRSVRDPAAVQAGLRDRGLAMPSIALRNDFTGDQGSVADSVDHLIGWLTIAESFGCRLARVWTGWQRVDATARRQITEALDEVVPHARRVGVALAVETHGGLSNHPAFLADLCDRYPSESFGVCLDFGNLPGDVRRFAIRRLAPITNHVHVKSYEFDASGVETTIPLAWAIRELDRAGFAGQWVIEYEGRRRTRLGSNEPWQRCAPHCTARRSRTGRYDHVAGGRADHRSP